MVATLSLSPTGFSKAAPIPATLRGTLTAVIAFEREH